VTIAKIVSFIGAIATRDSGVATDEVTDLIIDTVLEILVIIVVFIHMFGVEFGYSFLVGGTLGISDEIVFGCIVFIGTGLVFSFPGITVVVISVVRGFLVSALICTLSVIATRSVKTISKARTISRTGSVYSATVVINFCLSIGVAGGVVCNIIFGLGEVGFTFCGGVIGYITKIFGVTIHIAFGGLVGARPVDTIGATRVYIAPTVIGKVYSCRGPVCRFCAACGGCPV